MSEPSPKNRSKKTDQVHEESLVIKDGVDEQEDDGDYVTKEYIYIWDDENARIVVSKFIWFIVDKC